MTLSWVCMWGGGGFGWGGGKGGGVLTCLGVIAQNLANIKASDPDFVVSVHRHPVWQTQLGFRPVAKINGCPLVG